MQSDQQSIGGTIMLYVGMFMLGLFLPTIFFNELRKARLYYVFWKMRAEANELDPKRVHVDGNYQLVHCNAKARTRVPIIDDLFAMKLDNCIRMTRRVEMLQWVEVRREVQADGRRNIWYEYAKEWRTKLVDHRLFDQQRGHENPRQMPCESESFSCD